MIRVEKISINYNEVEALKEISFEVPKGALFGLIGPDGAGKTSLFRILTTLLLPSSGEGFVNGLNVASDFKLIRHQVGYMPGRFSLYQDLTIKENLNFFASVFNTTVEENYHLIEDIYVMLEPFKDRKAGKLSGGMKQKLALCCALIHKPKVLFLDEPTTGVDPVSRKEFWEMLQKLKLQDITILVSTPYMDEAALCDTVALINNGEILQIDSPNKIVDAYPYRIFNAVGNNFKILNAAKNLEFIKHAYAFGQGIHLSVETELSNSIDLIKEHISCEAIEEVSPTIEDSFMDLMLKTENQA